MSPDLPAAEQVRWTVIVPVFNGLEFLRRSLPPLCKAASENGAEILVVDDGSTDESAAFAAAQTTRHGLRILQSGGRALGPGIARNVGAKSARGELLLFIDADVVIHEDAFALLDEVLADAKTAGVFGAYDTQPPERNFASLYMNLRHHAYHQKPAASAGTFWSGLGAIRRQAYADVDGFDGVAYPRPSIEDIDLGMRITAAIGPIARDPRILGTHLKHWTLGGILHTDIFCRALPWSRLILENPGAFEDLNVSSGEQARALLAGILTLSIPAALFVPIIAWLPILLALAALSVNLPLFQVFRRTGGLLFACFALAFHQLYYLYGGAAFVYCRLTLGFGKEAKK